MSTLFKKLLVAFIDKRNLFSSFHLLKDIHMKGYLRIFMNMHRYLFDTKLANSQMSAILVPLRIIGCHYLFGPLSNNSLTDSHRLSLQSDSFALSDEWRLNTPY